MNPWWPDVASTERGGRAVAAVIWQGTDDEFARLQAAVAEYCDCVPAMLGLPAQICPCHTMLKNQSSLDHLLYVFRTRGVFVTREFYALPTPFR
jgi:hypothetical protein